MIIDNIENIKKYKGLYNNLDTAIDYVLSLDFQSLPLGKTEIKNNDVYINVIETLLNDEDYGLYEAHRHYLDLHINLDCDERILFCDYFTAENRKVYEDAEDYELLYGEKKYECIINKDSFCICMLNEPHKPCVRRTESKKEKCRKMIIKIKVK